MATILHSTSNSGKFCTKKMQKNLIGHFRFSKFLIVDWCSWTIKSGQSIVFALFIIWNGLQCNVATAAGWRLWLLGIERVAKKQGEFHIVFPHFKKYKYYFLLWKLYSGWTKVQFDSGLITTRLRSHSCGAGCSGVQSSQHHNSWARGD